MNSFTFALTKAATSVFQLPDPVVEIGSRLYGDLQEGGGLRTIFSGRNYIGCDISEGPGVERIEDITQLRFADGEVGTLLCLHILEHVWDVFAARKEIYRVVKPGGLAMIVCPFYLHLQRYPKDYWRFTDDSMYRMLDEFPWVIVGRHGYESLPRNVFAIGFKTREFPGIQEKCSALKEHLRGHEDDAHSFWQRLKLQLGYTLLSKKYFKDFVHRNDIVLEVHRPG